MSETKGIHLRLPWKEGRKTAWVRAANGRPLAEWAGEVLDRAAREAGTLTEGNEGNEEKKGSEL